MTGVTGQQVMLTPPWHLMPHLVCPRGLCLFYSICMIIRTGITKLMTVHFNGSHFFTIKQMNLFFCLAMEYYPPPPKKKCWETVSLNLDIPTVKLTLSYNKSTTILEAIPTEISTYIFLLGLDYNKSLFKNTQITVY
jgi:hypothetical protein